jgi:hypothetical protein
LRVLRARNSHNAKNFDSHIVLHEFAWRRTMARPEVTGRKVEQTTAVEKNKAERSTTAEKKNTRKLTPLPPRRPGDAYTIAEFCAANRIRESFYYKLKKQGRGPRERHVGRRVIITEDANREWQVACEREAASAA